MVKVDQSNVDDLARMIAELAEFEHLVPPTPEAVERLRYDVESGTPYFHAYIAYEGEEQVGYVFFFFTYSTLLAKPTLFIEDIEELGLEGQKWVGEMLAREARLTSDLRVLRIALMVLARQAAASHPLAPRIERAVGRLPRRVFVLTSPEIWALWGGAFLASFERAGIEPPVTLFLPLPQPRRASAAALAAGAGRQEA